MQKLIEDSNSVTLFDNESLFSLLTQLLDTAFKPLSDVVFLICVALTAANILIVIGLMVNHKSKWEPEYNKLPDGAVDAMKQPVINTDDTD